MPDHLTSGQRDWLRVRSYLLRERYELAVEAADEYPAGTKIAGAARSLSASE